MTLKNNMSLSTNLICMGLLFFQVSFKGFRFLPTLFTKALFYNKHCFSSFIIFFLQNNTKIINLKKILVGFWDF